MQKEKLTDGLAGLIQPVLPLIRIVQFLFLTGPFTTILEILEELKEPIDTNAVVYDDPKNTLLPYLDILKEFERIKDAAPSQTTYTVYSQEGEQLEAMEAMGAWISHHMLIMELERINSQLCGPCGCDLCCIGPDHSLKQEFFEIPLAAEEIDLFNIPQVNTEHSRKLSAYSTNTLQLDGTPFYKKTPTTINWKSGWSLILPKETTCPHLTSEERICQIYPKRPKVCRRPQIFSYLLERRPKEDTVIDKTKVKAYTFANKLLAVWDCPYVKVLKEEIARYAEMCELEPIFKQNKN
jgi:Fe-S-cluster containining protein